MTPTLYRRERLLRGTQAHVASLLGITRGTLSRRENGDVLAPISRESWLALTSLPKVGARKRVALEAPGESASERVAGG